MLQNIGPAGLILIALVVLILFGRGKIAAMMGEVGKGLSLFQKEMKALPEPETDPKKDKTPNKA